MNLKAYSISWRKYSIQKWGYSRQWKSNSISRRKYFIPGIGIPGSPAPEPIGRAGSHGCIRLSNCDAATFYTLVGKGTAVTIR